METALLAFRGNPVGVRTMGESGDQSYVPVLVEFLRFPWRLGSRSQAAVYSSLARLIDQRSEGLSQEQKVWDWWVHWLGNRPEVEPPPGFAAWKGQLYALLVDPEMGAFLYEGVPTRIRLEEIVWGGVVKDGIPDLTNPRIISAEEATYLEPSDRVFGVSFTASTGRTPTASSIPTRWPTTWWAECHSPWPTEPSAALESCIPQSSMAKPWSSGPPACSTGATS